MLIWLSVGAHHLLLMALADSFHLLPIGASWSFHGWAALNDAVSAMFVTGLRLMAPVLILLLFVYVALGLLARAVPQIQVFFVSAPLTVALGLLVFALSLPAFVMILQQSYAHLGALLPDFLHAMAGT
jgi:flagellar biosynthetic protein FliR